MTGTLNLDEITRYIFDDKHFSRPEKNKPEYVRIKKNAVTPMTNDETGEKETSVMHTSGCNEAYVDSLGKEHVAVIREEELVAYVRFSTKVLSEQDLKLVNDKYQHDRHCAIVGWPASKEDIIEKADDLANAISIHQSRVFKEF